MESTRAPPRGRLRTIAACLTFAMPILANYASRLPDSRALTPQARAANRPVRPVECPRPGFTKGWTVCSLLYDAVTRPTRVAKLAPGTLIGIEVIGQLPKAIAGEPKIGGLLP